MSKNNKGSKSSKKVNAKKGSNKLPKGVTINPSGTYRVRKMVNGQVFDKSLSSKKEAIIVNKTINS